MKLREQHRAAAQHYHRRLLFEPLAPRVVLSGDWHEVQNLRVDSDDGTTISVAFEYPNVPAGNNGWQADTWVDAAYDQYLPTNADPNDTDTFAIDAASYGYCTF